MRTAMAVLVALLVGAQAQGQPFAAQPYDGHSLRRGLKLLRMSTETLGVLTDEDQREAKFAFGYVLGATDTWYTLKPDLFCQPDYTIKRDILDAVSNYLERHPERSYQGAAGLVGLALAEAFPCGKGKTP